VNYGGGGQGAYGAQPQMGRIEVNMEFNPMQLFLHGIKPRIVVNGYPYAPSHWGRQSFDMPPGNHDMLCAFPYLFSDNAGSARMMIPVYSGHVTIVNYTAPGLMFMGGSMRIVQTVPMMHY
jgi:hypothetical protein